MIRPLPGCKRIASPGGVGSFDYTQIGRSFDGEQLGYEKQLLNVTAFGFVPNWGGDEINGNPEISQVAVAGLSATLKEGELLRARAHAPSTSTVPEHALGSQLVCAVVKWLK